MKKIIFLRKLEYIVSGRVTLTFIISSVSLTFYQS